MNGHELNLLACCVLDPDCLGRAVLAGVQEPWFTSDIHRFLWRGIIERSIEGRDIDQVWVNEYLLNTPHKNYRDKFTKIYSDIISPRSETMSAIEIMKRNYRRRQLSGLFNNINRRLYTDEPAILIEEIINGIGALKQTQDNDHQGNIEQRIAEQLKHGIEISTGFHKLDFLTKGIEPGVLWIIGGHTQHGKSTLALNIALNVASKSHPVTFFTTEMTNILLVKRIATTLSGVNPSITTGMSEVEKEAFMVDVKKALEMPFEIHQTLSLANIRLQIQKRESKLYIVDYIQMIQPEIPQDGEVKRLGYVVRELETISKDYEVCIIATSQFHRLPSDDKKYTPTLSSYRGSGEIEENTDIGILMWYPYQQATFERQQEMKEDGKDNLIKICVQKNRIHGLTGVIALDFDRRTLRMKEMKDDS